jgi:sarcosine oxidase gamma subunit
MPEAFPDPMAKWSPAPDWRAARLTRSDWSAAPADDLSQLLISGNLAAALATFEPAPVSVGLWQIAPTGGAIRIARDRALLVAAQALAAPAGWQAAGWVATDASDAYRVIEIAGSALRAIVAEAVSADLDAGSPSAAILFAGVPALLYRTGETRARLHVEAALAPYVWRCLETR